MLTEKQIIETFNVNEIIKKYPKSGQKKVYLVRTSEYGECILKFIEGNFSRVLREIEIIVENDFNNVPKIFKTDLYSIDSKNGIYILEEYIEGENLKEILEKSKLTITECLDLAEDLLKILVELEKNSIIHRDIKPDNIIKGNNRKWYLIDFGIARALEKDSLTKTENNIGPHTPGYGAPESIFYNKKNIDSRSDIFSLGIVLFEAATGNHPYLLGNEKNNSEVSYNTVTLEAKDIQIEGDVNNEFSSLILTFIDRLITRRPNTSNKALEWFFSVKECLRKGD